MKTVEIIPFENKYAKHFYELNVEWLQTYFYVEPFDEEVLSKPHHYIIAKGGHIFFAKHNDIILGTVALMPTEDPMIFELTKMAVLPNQRGQNIGQQLLQHCINFARLNSWRSLKLYSAKLLENAIYLYRKYGFVELSLEPECPYKRSDIKMELIL